ncbi:MAG: hypothetical protein EA390_02515 [Balneolaceae bacterium]|nr:MAG: hypothetical protein EA390_02515 [Balneolaceae bacterium]
MKLSEFKTYLSGVSKLNFLLPDGQPVPSHFHITEAGLVTKHFIDCGKTIHLKKTAMFQLWTAQDVWHRLKPETLIEIINKSDKVFRGEDPDVEIEYQMETIGKFGLTFKNGDFILTTTHTDCLAKEKCEIIPEMANHSDVADSEVGFTVCEPSSGCC